MVAGFILLAMVVHPSLWVVILFSVVIFALLFFMFHSLKKLEKSIEKGKDNEKK
jgi:Ca2+/Na+ antiporter